MNIGEETEQIEFKKSTGEMKEAMISIVSILNKHGSGELYFGVKNNGDVIGQEISDSTLRDISQAVGNHIKPPIYPEIAKRDYDGKQVVYVGFKGDRAPYLAYNVPRIRIADEDKIMDQSEYNRLLRAREDAVDTWEMKVSKKTVDDIIEEDLKLYLYRAKEANRISFDSDDPKVVMDKLELLSDDGVHLINAGAMLFCRTDLADVQMAKFATDVKATFLDIRREDFGSIIGQSEKCIQYIIDAMDWKADIVGTKRVETPEIPVAAVREAIINSYGHRVYNNGQNNEIDVFKDRIEIHTTGGFPDGHTPEEFFDGEHKAIRRNRMITRVLYFSKDMETFATGLKRIKNLCDEAGCKIGFRLEKDDFVVVFYRNLREEWSKEGSQGDKHVSQSANANRKPHKIVEKSEIQSATQSANGTLKSRDANKTKLRKIIIQNPNITRKQMSESLGISVRSVQRLLDEMEDVRFTGGGRSGHWEIV